MAERIHDDEPDTSEATVRALLRAQCPQWSASPLEALATSGTDNAMWRVAGSDQDDVVVRLPRRPGAAANVGTELDVLTRLSTSSLRDVVDTPSVRHVGEPEEVFPHRWCVLGWLPGVDAWTERKALDGALDAIALDVADAVRTIGSFTDMPGAARRLGDRGGPIGPLLDRLDWWLTDPGWDAPARIDVDAVRRLAYEARETLAERVPTRFVHGDLIPGNVLIGDGRLSAIIDWGGAGWGDPAQDLAPAWSIFEGTSRRIFQAAVDVDDATWIRARTFELEHAVGGVLYYGPRRHPLGDVMARTLARILADP